MKICKGRVYSLDVRGTYRTNAVNFVNGSLEAFYFNTKCNRNKAGNSYS